MIIGINGKIGSGKDTLAMMLQALTIEANYGSFWKQHPLEYARDYKDRPNLKGGWRIVKCADKMKEFGAMMLGVTKDEFENRDFKNSPLGPEWDGITGREWMLGFGDACRKWNPMFFVNGTFVDYRPSKKEGGFQRIVKSAEGIPVDFEYEVDYPDWIISDIRMPNEFDEVKKRGGIMVRVIRPDNPLNKGGDAATETSLDQYTFDVEVTNHTLEGLVADAAKILMKVGYGS